MSWEFWVLIVPAIIFIMTGSTVGYFVTAGHVRETLILSVGLGLTLLGGLALVFVGVIIIYPIGLLILGVGTGRWWRARRLPSH
jgi:hypothetical protein